MLSDFLCSAGAAQSHEDKPPRSVLRYRVEKQWKNSGKTVEKCSKAIKKTSEKLAQMKNLHYLCIKQKNKRPGYPGND